MPNGYGDWVSQQQDDFASYSSMHEYPFPVFRLLSPREPGSRREDNVTDRVLGEFRAAYTHDLSKDDILYYVYGLLHSPAYRTEFAADLKQMLPRIPQVRDFVGFAEAGRRLADLHLNYESVEPYPLVSVVTGEGPQGSDDYDWFRVTKMTFPREPGSKAKNRRRILYNANLMLANVPEAAYRYQLGSRSAIEWIMDRYQVRTDKASGIVNDPNDWSREHGQPRYILDLLMRIVTVSLETMRIVDALPPLDVFEGQ